MKKFLIKASYQDDKVYLVDGSYPAGSFAVQLLNQCRENETNTRMNEALARTLLLQRAMSHGHLSADALPKAAKDTLVVLDLLPDLAIFSLADITAERERIQTLFSDKNASHLLNFFRRRTITTLDEERGVLHLQPTELDDASWDDAEPLACELAQTLSHYKDLGEDIVKVFRNLRQFVRGAEIAEHYDEAHLTPIAMDAFGPFLFPATIEYVPQENGRDASVARRLYFDNYYSFIVTDFFEGLHHGHYPRQCEVCGRYFLMTSARRQKYCDGNAPFKIKGKTVSCRDYGARIKEKERAEDNPVVAAYKSLTSNIRVDKHRKNISPRFADAAKSLAEEHKQRALADPAYAKDQYYLDMKQDALYSVVRKTVPQKEGDG